MSFPRWLTKLFHCDRRRLSPPRYRKSAKPRRFRPRLEALEDKIVPSVTIEPFSTQSSNEGDSISGLFASATSSNESATITYSADNLPTGLQIISDTGEIQGDISYTAYEQSGGAFSVTITATDGTDSDSTNFTWNIGDTPLAPSVTLNSNASPAVYGTDVVFTANVSGASDTPSGSIDFLINGTTLSTTSLVDGQAQFDAGVLAAGSYSVTAAYGGDDIYAADSAGMTQTINPAGVAVTLSSPGSLVFGQTASFPVSVSSLSGYGTPTGSVILYDPTGAFAGSATLDDSGDASILMTAANVGSGDFEASYAGDDNFAGGSGSVSETVSAADTTTTIVSA